MDTYLTFQKIYSQKYSPEQNKITTKCYVVQVMNHGANSFYYSYHHNHSSIQFISLKEMIKLNFKIPAPVIIDPRKEVFPVASAPSRLALVKFACRKRQSV